MTHLLVLGLLKEKPLSGYDIQMLVQLSDAEKWGGVSVGAIYHALKKLERDEYIEVSYIQPVGNRKKAVYQITASGRERLFKITEETLRTSSVRFPAEFYSSLMLMECIPEEKRCSALRQHKEKMEEDFASLATRLDMKKDTMNNQSDTIRSLIFEDMLSHMNQQISFVDQLIKLLEQK